MAAAGAAGTGADFVRALASGDLKPGATSVVEITDGVKVLLARTRDGVVHAHPNRCPHKGLPLGNATLDGDRLTCPFHAACFDVRTGDIEDGPAVDCLPTYQVEEREDGEIYVAVPAGAAASRPPTFHAADADAGASGIVIVGSGAAALGAVETLRAEGYTGKLTVVTTATTAGFVDRPTLSKNPAAAVAGPVLVRPEAFYQEDLGVTFRLNMEVTAVDTAAHTVSVCPADGLADLPEALPYTKLLVATGAAARTFRADRNEGFSIPGAQLSGIFAIREPAEAAALETAIDAAMAASPGAVDVVVVGSSFIGMEVAGYLAGSKGVGEGRGLRSVTVVGMESEPFERVLGTELGAAMRRLHEAVGTRFVSGATVQEFQAGAAAGSVGSVRLQSGQVLPASVVVVGAGVIPRTTLLKDAAGVELLPRGGGVVVDQHLQACADVFAAGDIAAVPNPYAVDEATSRVRIEHWDVAMDQGRTAARNMLGQPTPFTTVPFFWSGQLGKNIRYAGVVRAWDEVVVQGDLAAPKATVFYVRGGKVAAVATLQDDPQAVAAQSLLRAGRMPSPEAVKATEKFDLRTLLE